MKFWNEKQENKKTFALIYVIADCVCEGFFFFKFSRKINNKKDIHLISHDEHS